MSRPDNCRDRMSSSASTPLALASMSRRRASGAALPLPEGPGAGAAGAVRLEVAEDTVSRTSLRSLTSSERATIRAGACLISLQKFDRTLDVWAAMAARLMAEAAIEKRSAMSATAARGRVAALPGGSGQQVEVKPSHKLRGVRKEMPHRRATKSDVNGRMEGAQELLVLGYRKTRGCGGKREVRLTWRGAAHPPLWGNHGARAALLVACPREGQQKQQLKASSRVGSATKGCTATSSLDINRGGIVLGQFLRTSNLGTSGCVERSKANMRCRFP